MGRDTLRGSSQTARSSSVGSQTTGRARKYPANFPQYHEISSGENSVESQTETPETLKLHAKINWGSLAYGTDALAIVGKRPSRSFLATSRALPLLDAYRKHRMDEPSGLIWQCKRRQRCNKVLSMPVCHTHTHTHTQLKPHERDKPSPLRSFLSKHPEMPK